eukprot:TRINITY_DN17747_c0_g1_i1.p1 TRINITY_DN17747_c0_g1~~TRINITY_DN17747_c0_g1_i1.p1  ORF type:complete len:824 (+),score=278.10 TRINITY_DN17747_c0_g1_i1:79-2550(+)
MCSPQELAELRAELSALVGDCEVLGSALQGGYLRLGKTVRGLGNRLATLDDTSSFGFDLRHDLSFARWCNPRPASIEDVTVDMLPVNMRAAFEIMTDAAALCKEARDDGDANSGCYIDPDYTSHDLEDARELPAIAIGLQAGGLNKDAVERRKVEKERLEAQQVGAAITRLFIWRRPGQIYPAYALFPQGNKLLEDWPTCLAPPQNQLPHLECYTQGCFDDSWFVLAMSSIATHRHLFQQIFASCDYADYGMYAFQFCDVAAGEDPTVPTAAEMQQKMRLKGERRWRTVIIDSHIPMQLQGTDTLVPMFGRTSEETALWLVYVMKAYAKWRGSYSYLHSGDTARVCSELTGGRARTERWNKQRITPESLCVLWWKLVLTTRLGLIAMCADMPNRVDSGNIEQGGEEDGAETQWRDGEQIILSAELPASLTTDYLGVRKEAGLKLIKLRNLYGRPTAGNGGQWDWGPSSTKWKDKRVRQYFSYTRMHECVAWIGCEDFARNYNTLLTVSCWEGAPFVNFASLDACPAGQAACYAHQYLLSLELCNTDELTGAAEDALLAVQAKIGSALYEPPDFRELDLEEGDVPDGPTGRGSEEEKGMKVTVFISTPNMSAMAGTRIIPQRLVCSIFRLQQRRLQAPEQRGSGRVDEEQADEQEERGDRGDSPQPASPEAGESDGNTVRTEYFWPRYNLVESQSEPVKDPCGSLEKTRELELLEQQWSFTVAQPGIYAVAIEQENPLDEIEYCVHVTTEEISPQNPSGLSLRAEFGGTHSDPLVRPDPRSSAGGFASQGSFTMSRSRGPSIGMSETPTEMSPSRQRISTAMSV